MAVFRMNGEVAAHAPRVMSFYLSLSIVISLVLSSTYLGIYIRNAGLLEETVRMQARSYFDLVLKTRRWNAEYGGVYVEKKEGVASNPYLKQAGVNPDLRAADGRVLTLRNPALMTREISELLRHDNGARFRITSLKPLNPGNAPDAFEAAALNKFERGVQQVEALDGEAGKRVFRYIAPLRVEEGCMKCHASQGYKVGDIRGGISVDIPYETISDELARTRNVIIGLTVLTIGLLLAATYHIVIRFSRQIASAHAKLVEMSVTDGLTRLYNRRYFMERLDQEFNRARRENQALGALMVDLDGFKSINDTHGHAMGDAVLRTTAETLRQNVRDYDIVARYGGEEFIVLSPGAGIETIAALGERLRQAIGGTIVTHERLNLSITASVGAGVLVGADGNGEAFIRRVDGALYEAKAEGRNRVAMARG